MYKTKEFIFKNELVEWIAEYYSLLGEALDDMEYNELNAIYVGRPNEDELPTEAGQFKDFWIFRESNGNWFIKWRA